MEREKLLRRLPPVHELVKACSGEEKDGPLHVLTEAAREVLNDWRGLILEKGEAPPALAPLAEAVKTRVREKLRPHLRPVINATGVILHTNLGRAPLSAAALSALERVARGYCNLEIDLNTGERGSRYSHVENLLTALTGAEAALVVNNNAAAVLLALHTLARGREVIVSRGELIEIGGSFRIPEVLAQSGARLQEVGTTNKTYPRDYERAIGPETALLLKVHTSNYRILGFTREVTRSELVSLGRKYQVPVLEDLGSGVLVDLQRYGLGPEPTVQASLEAGVDVVTFSGDKLLGGPQAGIIVGRARLLQGMKENPLLRALRVDKLILAALEATLREYLKGEAEHTLPVLERLFVSPDRLAARAAALKERLLARLEGACEVDLQSGFSQVGGGALPLTQLSTTLLVLRPKTMSATAFAAELRRRDPPVFTRLQDAGVLLDPRTLSEEEEEPLVEAVRAVLREPAQKAVFDRASPGFSRQTPMPLSVAPPDDEN